MHDPGEEWWYRIAVAQLPMWSGSLPDPTVEGLGMEPPRGPVTSFLPTPDLRITSALTDFLCWKKAPEGPPTKSPHVAPV